MPFNWSEIESKWLLNTRPIAPKETIINSFNTVRNEFGEGFFNTYSFLRGQYIQALILDLAKIIDGKKGNCILPLNGEIIQRIQDNKVHLNRLILQLAAYFLKKGFTVEFEPEVNSKKPDLRVNFQNQWFYIEETKLYNSKRFTDILGIMDIISKVIQTVNRNIHISVILLKEELTTQEVNQIVDAIKNVSLLDLPQVFEIKQLVRISTSNKFQSSFESTRPTLCSDCLLVGNGFERHLHIEIQFSDIRLNKILKKAKQLPPQENSLIILDISLPGNLKKWIKPTENAISKHGKICAVLLIEEHHFIRSLEIDSHLILNPSCSKSLSEDFYSLIKDCLKERSLMELSS